MKRIAFVLVALIAATVAVEAAPTSGAASPISAAGSIDGIGGGKGRVVSGWVAVDSPIPPRIVIVADGVEVKRLEPSESRFDVPAALGAGLEAWGFRATLTNAPGESVCLSVVVGANLRGLDCVFIDSAAFAPALGGGSVFGDEGRIVRYSVEVEGRARLHPESVARVVDRILGDGRSWSGDDRWRFRRVRPERANVRILVASPATVDRLCVPFRTGGFLSCRRNDRVILNVDRWNGAVAHWTAPLGQYRAYLVNHELGHYLGFDHVPCPGPGRRAPVMMQQTKSLQGCRPNGWPRP